ncbi:MAG TPA: PilZ domain-containing protein, partial [Polyangia bacterium]|nr:PilZ domain-containing protein [Polyangia bacterium]
MPTPSDALAEDTANPSASVESNPVEPDSVEPSPNEQRAHFRFDKMFTVRLESPLFGESYCIARNVSAGGIFLELPDPLPLGATVRVCFITPDSSGEVVATGEVKNHY